MLRYIPLGGVATTANKNLHVYETENDILLVDAGAGFPDADQYGVDIVIPDVSYLQDKLDKIRAIIVTHAHFDHYGALPYLLKDLRQPPIYSTRLPRAFIQKDLAEHQVERGQSLYLIGGDTDRLELGDFTVYPYYVNHSVPDSVGLFIHTPEGNFVHNADFKFDWTPVDGRLFEVRRLAKLVDQDAEGVLCLMSDCLGAAREGYTMSERYIETAFEREIKDALGQVFLTTLSSNISRIQQAIYVANKYGRKAIPLGRSIEENIEIARKMGYLNVPRGVIVNNTQAHKIKPQERLFIATGAFGQSRSAISQLAYGEHSEARISVDDVVIFSADPIPGVHDKVGAVIDLLTEAGARVVYSELADDLHTSGHGSQGDLSMLAGLVQPKYFVPIGGTFSHMRAYANLMEAMGFKRENVLELHEGDVLEFHNGQVKVAGQVSTRSVFVDGKQVGDVGRVVLQDRQRLAEEGIFVVIVKKDAQGALREDVDVISRGFVYVAESEKLIDEAIRKVQKTVRGKTARDWSRLRRRVQDELGKMFYQKMRRYPMVLPVLVDV